MTAVWIVLASACSIALLVLFMVWPGGRNREQESLFIGFNYAHRGLHTEDKKVPENSLAAFAAAADAGYGMELDVQLSKDGQVVVFHDDTLDRVCGVHGRVDAFTYEELRAFRLEGTQQHIPLLEEMLALVEGRTPLIIELKMGPENDKLCAKVVEILRGYTGAYCVESFDPRIVRWFKKNAKDILRGQLASNPRSLGRGAGEFWVGTLLCNFLGRPHFVAYDTGTRPFTVRIAQALAMKVVWTVLPQDDIEQLQQKNDGVIFEYYTPEPRYKTS